MRLPQLAAALLAAFACLHTAQAGDVTDVTLSGATLDTIAANRAGMAFSYTAADLVNVTLTDIQGVSDDGDRVRLFVPNGGSVPADRSSVIEDLNLNTGFNNAESITVDFNTPLINSGGIDLILFDWGTKDPITVTINGVTRSYTSSDYDNEPGGSLTTSIFRSAGAVNSVSELESDSYASFSGSASAQTAVGIDLSDFGIALNASATTVRFDDNTTVGSAMDPLAVVGLTKVGGLVDDFEQNYAGTNNINGQSGWTVNGGSNQVTVFDPTGGTAFDDNRVLRVRDSSRDIFHAATIADGLIGYLQFDVYNPTNNGQTTEGDPIANSPDWGIGLTTQAVPNEAADFGPMVRVVGGDLQAYDGGFKTLLTSTFARDTWYTIQLAIDNLNDTYQVFIKGGSFADFTLLDASGDDTFDFRSGAGANDLVNFYIRTNGGHAGDIGYIDNVFVLIPTPAAFPAGLVMLGVLTMRRR
jgi:hypothetical protein